MNETWKALVLTKKNLIMIVPILIFMFVSNIMSTSFQFIYEVTGKVPSLDEKVFHQMEASGGMKHMPLDLIITDNLPFIVPMLIANVLFVLIGTLVSAYFHSGLYGMTKDILQEEKTQLQTFWVSAKTHYWRVALTQLILSMATFVIAVLPLVGVLAKFSEIKNLPVSGLVLMAIVYILALAFVSVWAVFAPMGIVFDGLTIPQALKVGVQKTIANVLTGMWGALFLVGAGLVIAAASFGAGGFLISSIIAGDAAMVILAAILGLLLIPIVIFVVLYLSVFTRIWVAQLYVGTEKQK